MLKSISSITNAIGALNYKGTWNASTNTPTIVSSVGVKGDYYVVSVAGTTTINSISNWGVGDWIAFNGSVWQRVEGGADLNGVNITFTGTASGPTYETSNAANGLTITNNEINADGTDTDINILVGIKGSGGLLVGKTTNFTVPSFLQVATVDGGKNGISVGNESGSAATVAIRFINSNGSVGSVITSASATSFNTSSDYRLKEQIYAISDPIEKVLALKPCSYTWKCDGSIGEGFIAHELQEVAPYAVSGEKDGEQMQGVDYGKLTPILTAALQDAIAKIENLEARIAVLEAK